MLNHSPQHSSFGLVCRPTQGVSGNEDTQLKHRCKSLSHLILGSVFPPTATLPWLHDYNYYLCFLKCSISGLNHVCLLF